MSVGLEGGTSGMVQQAAIPLALDRLPEDLLQKIFSLLNGKDQQTVTLVNRSISNSVITAANLNERAALKNFIQRLVEGLNAEIFLGQRNMLVEISREITRQNFENLRLLKGYILEVKAQLINVIKTLDRETASSLESSVPPPNFLEDIFVLAALERQIDAAILIPDEYERGRMFWALSKDLRRAGNTDRAVDIVRLIPNQQMSGAELWNIAETFIKEGNFDRGIQIAMSISEGDKKKLALSTILQALIKAGNFDKAITIATAIPEEDKKGYVLHNISATLTKEGNIDRAIAVARLIPRQDMRGWAVFDIYKALIQGGNIERASVVATLIPYGDARNLALAHSSRFQ